MFSELHNKVSGPTSIPLLLVEDDAEDEHLLSEAIAEIIESPEWPNWHSCDLIPAGTLQEAIELLRVQDFEAVLLNLSLPGASSLLDCFECVRNAAPTTPIIVLADYEDENLAHTLLRHGAQDVLPKSEIDGRMLARALRYGIERQRRLSSIQAISFFDDVTGLYNRRGFDAFADHDIEFARMRGVPLRAAVLELTGVPDNNGQDGREARDLILIRAGEILRESFGATSVVARIGAARFGILASGLSEDGLECALRRFEGELRAAGPVGWPAEVRCGSASFAPDAGAPFPHLLEEAESRLGLKPAILTH